MDPLRYCRERLLVPGSTHSIARLFAPDEQAEQLLAAHTVLDQLLEIPVTVSDAEVAARKLEWWRGEIAAAYAAGGDHPAARALRESGAAGRIPHALFDELLTALARVCQAGPPGDMDALRARASALGGGAATVEAAVVEPGAPAGALRELGAAGWLVRTVRDLRACAALENWPVPLSLRARWQVQRARVATGTAAEGKADGWAGLVHEMLEPARAALEERHSALPPGRAWVHRHRLVLVELDWRLLHALWRKPQRILAGRYRPNVLGDVWRARAAARRLHRRAARVGRDGSG